MSKPTLVLKCFDMGALTISRQAWRPWSTPRPRGASPSYRALRLEAMEERALLSAGMQYDHIVYNPAVHARRPTVDGPLGGAQGVAPLSSSGPEGLVPQQILNAYGINAINYGSIMGANGAGQTIVIVDAYDDPDLVDSTSSSFDTSDLYKFDHNPEINLPDPPSFKKVDQTGGTDYPAVSGSSGWAVEESLDVEWAHAIAPAANIILVEANSTSFSDMVGSTSGSGGAVQNARTWAGVSVISMSFGTSEGSGETAYDTYFTTPAGHTGITFLAATGDSGAPGYYPAYSPNVLAVGGTTLSTDANGDYVGETGWAWNTNYNPPWGGGGGQSTQEPLPSYQDPGGVALKYYATPNDESLSNRGAPDVSFDADPVTGVAIRDSYDYGSSAPWQQVGGTSLATPCWAGLIAIADQLRAAKNVPLLSSSSAHSLLYSIYENSAQYAAAFHDVSGGNNNGFSAGPGYDLVTGVGSPVANVLVPALVSTALYSANMNTNPGWAFTSGSGDQWAFGAPTGSGGDPSAGYTGSNVVGYNLSGTYAKNIASTYWATTPAINCSGYTAVTLDFWRWLGVSSSSHAHAYIEVSSNGTNWTIVWQNSSSVVDTAWTEQTFDISAVANNQSTVYLRWGMGTTDNTTTYCGWNIDDLTVMGLRSDIVPPTVASLTPSVATVTDANVKAAGFALTVTFNEAMNTATAPTISFPTQNPAGTLSFDSAASGWSNSTTYVARYDVTDSDTTLSNIEVAVTGAQDADGNTQIEGDFTGAFSIDTQQPTVTINLAGGQASPTTASPINFTVVFSETVGDFAAGGVTLSGTAGATTAVVTGSGTTYNVAVSGMTGSGTVIATVAAGVAHDAVGNPNYASTTTDNTVSYVADTPRVANVVVGSDAWSGSFVSYLAAQNPANAGGYSIPVGSGAQLLPLPWTNIDEIKVTFNENVTVDQTDLMLEGVNTPSYNVAGGTFAYNAATFTATWTLPAAIPDDKLLLELNADGADPIQDALGNRLDGEWSNPVLTSDTGTSQYPSGNGTPGSSNFLFRFNVLPGNVSQDGYVQALDGLLVRGALGSTTGQGNYSIFKDVNGDATVLSSDGLLVIGRLGTSLPAGQPVASAFPSTAGHTGGSFKSSPSPTLPKLGPRELALISVVQQLENGGLSAPLLDPAAGLSQLLSPPEAMASAVGQTNSGETT